MASCRTCEDPIEWGELPSGKMIALEPAPAGAAERLFTLVKGKARPATADDRRLHRPLYVCHWDRCDGGRER